MENPRQKIKSIKNPIKHLFLIYFIKSETSDSFVNHFDDHFAYLKTLDFYIKDLSDSKAVIIFSVSKNKRVYRCTTFSALR